MNQQHDYDYVIIGSGFGGSVSVLRLSEKGYKVLVLEKGKWWHASDFPKTIWNLKKWMWGDYMVSYEYNLDVKALNLVTTSNLVAILLKTIFQSTT